MTGAVSLRLANTQRNARMSDRTTAVPYETPGTRRTGHTANGPQHHREPGPAREGDQYGPQLRADTAVDAAPAAGGRAHEHDSQTGPGPGRHHPDGPSRPRRAADRWVSDL